MSLLQSSNAFCIFCYKSINSYLQTSNNVDNVKQFVKIIGRFVGCKTPDNLLGEQGTHENLSTLFFKCCKDCREYTDQFCELYHQFKLLELQLDFKLNKFVDKLEHANKVPTRWMHLNKVLEKAFPDDVEKRKQSQITVSDLRRSIVKAANQRLKISQPRVLVQKEKILAALDGAKTGSYQSSATTVSHNEIFTNGIQIKRNDVGSERLEKSHSVTKHDNDNNDDFVNILELKNTGQDIQFQCKLCQKQFPDQSELQQHIKMKLCVKIYTDENGNFVCPECGKRCRAISLLAYHLEFHKDPEEWKWECKDCGRKCVSKDSLKVHLRTHTKEKPFVCRFCGIKFRYNSTLKSHLVKRHGQEKWMEKKKEGYLKAKRVFEKHVDSEKKLLSCKSCKKSFPKFKHLRDHVKAELCNKKEDKLRDIVKCEDCLEIFSSDNALWTHQKEIHKIKVCLECGKQFNASYNYTLHLEYHKDPKEWEFECKSCGRKCPSKYKLKEHLVICKKTRMKKKTLKKNKKR